MEKDNKNSWNEYSRLVLHELEVHSKQLIEINEKVSRLKTDITILKTKVAMVGVLSGIAGSVVVKIILTSFHIGN